MGHATHTETAPWVTVTLMLTFYIIGCWAQTVLPILAKGSKFFDSSGKQFYIRGIIYGNGDNSPASPGSAYDPLAVPEQCALDAPLMQTLLVNTVRVYQVNNNKSHDECMQTFAQHGIYVVIGLDSSEYAIDQQNPKWNQSMFDSFTKTLDDFAKHDNLLAVYVGNEVVREDSGVQFDQGQNAAPYIRAAARDIKAYRDAQLYRQIPVGYASQDISDLEDLRDYLACGGENTTTTDFFSLNRFSWCGNSTTFLSSGYQDLYNASLDFPAPLFFSETGCNILDRTFNDQVAVLGPQMNSKWSGNIIYEWPQQKNSFGIVKYPSTASSFGSTGTPTPISPDFYNLQSNWDTLTPTGVSLAQYTPTQTSLACPTSKSGGWTINGRAPLPTIKNLVIPSKTATSETPAAISTSSESPSQVSSTTETPDNKTSNPKTRNILLGTLIPLFVIIIIGCIIAFTVYSRRKKRAAAAISKTNVGTPETTEPFKPELHSDSRAVPAQLHADDTRRELDGLQRHQLYDDEPTEAPPIELNGASSGLPAAELATSGSVRRNAEIRA